MRNKILSCTDFELEVLVRKQLGQQKVLDEKKQIIHGEIHARFDFGGTNDHSPFNENNTLLDLFTDYGIYDYLTELEIHSWKGQLTLKCENKLTKKPHEIVTYSGQGTVEVIIDIIKRTYIGIVK